MQDNRNFLGTEPIGKLLLKLSIPTVIAQLINMLYNIVDRIYIGHIPGEGSLALTGVGVCMPIIMLVSAFAALISTGGAPRASISMGKQDNKAAEKILGNCFVALVSVSMVLTAILLIWGEPLLMAFGASENTISYATNYLSIYAIGTIFVQLTLGMNAFITCQGFTTISMVSVLVGAICNITLDPIFIFVMHMGVSGAAVATVISQALSTIWVMRFLCGRKTQLHLRKDNMRLEAKVILPCLALGLATFVMQSSESIIAVCFNSSAITSYNYGARNAERVKQTFRLLLTSCLTYSVALWAAVELCPRLFASIFTQDAELIAFTAPMLRIYLGGLLLFGIQIACQMTFTSLGKALNSIVVAVVRKFVLLLPLIYIMPHLVANPTVGVYMAEPVADILAITFTAILFSVQFKKALSQINE